MFLYFVFFILFLFVMLYLLAIKPEKSGRANFKPFEGYYYAHRGLHKKKVHPPENSILAFRQAVEKNYGIELDVQLSKDNIPVVFHDYSLKRMCGIDKKVNELTYSELEGLRLYSSNQKIPLFEDVLRLVGGKVPIIVELKVEDQDTTLCDIVAPILDRYKGDFCIESFNPLVLLWFKEHRLKVIRGQLASNFLKEEEYKGKLLYFALENLLLNFLTKPNFIAFNYKYAKMFSFSLCKKLYKVPTFAWTIQSKEALEEARESFDYFIFERFEP
ncbi:glycerophosphodiester phosphodiesterase family protein [Alkalibaculum bacchi]|uniref:glycerophosphodiester phosphodiesterase family protein n=1 Tax=Alkalibaculum bacchi TaxID=645887 RepID=UPI0026EF0779|nr:glycerophosphodiester phosphodiesterase family protein [Alkalibaculum bacchi]